MKKINPAVALLVLSASMLIGCASHGESISAASSASSSAASSVSNASDEVGYAAGRNVFDNYMKADKIWKTEAYVDAGETFMPSRGKSKLLVVPVVFSDDTSTDTELEDNREAMRKAFFGEATETSWQSVHSYYYQSSYHQLDIQGEVAKTIKADKTFTDYTTSKLTAIVNILAEELFDKLFTADTAQYKGKTADFDSNGDGVVDGIYFISNNAISSSTDLGWAFTTHHYFTTSRAKYTGARFSAFGTYAWSSINFMTRTASERASLATPDAHTYIHEMGHQLGLNDYYDPNTQGSEKAGGSTMQDENICDHDGYSKYLWGWATPQVVTDKNTEASLTITLKPSESSGDGLVLTSDFNGTALDEYLYIEYYTPTGLNAHDVAKSYEGKDQQGVNESGIRVWHVDKNILQAHMGKTKNDKGATVDTAYFDPNPVKTLYTNGADQDYSFPDDIAPEDDNLHTSDDMTNQDDDFYTSYTTNNSKDYSDATTATQNFFVSPELQIVRAKSSGSAVIDSAALFKQGSTFGTENDASKDFSFYSPAVVLDYNCSGTDWDNAAKIKLPYSFTVTSLTDDAATLTLTKLA